MLGKNADGYWKNEDLVSQMKFVNPIFKAYHPNCDLLYCFDNSSNHHAKCPDGLCAESLNLTDGGKNTPIMRNTTFNGTEFKMQTDLGVSKGVRSILMERGKWRADLNLKCKECHLDPNFACCGRRMLSLEDDFKAQQGWLAETATTLGVSIIFLPKFHCELNFIEMIWGYVKANLRRACEFSFRDLREKLTAMLMKGIPQDFFKKAYIHCLRCMDAYRQGYTGPLLDYAMKKNKGHRLIPVDQKQMIHEEYEKKITSKQEKYYYVN